MLKKIISAVMFSALVFTSSALLTSTPTEAKVFHRNVAVDNGDGCVTPQEIAGFRTGNFEKIGFYEGADADKLKIGVTKIYPDTKIEQMTWAALDAYSFVGPDGKVTVLVTIYNKDDKGQLCAAGGGPVPMDDWTRLVKAAELQPAATWMHPGFAPAHPKTRDFSKPITVQ